MDYISSGNLMLADACMTGDSSPCTPDCLQRAIVLGGGQEISDRGIVMFNNKKTDETQFGVSASHQSASTTSRGSVSTHSIVDECLTMKGDLESDGDILVKGKVLGNIRCEVLIVDKDALVEGGVEAKEVIIRGKTNGTIKAARVSLEKTADVDSEICHDTFSAEEGARIKGTLRLNDESSDGQTKAVKAKAAARPMSAARPTKDVANGHIEEAGSGSA